MSLKRRLFFTPLAALAAASFLAAGSPPAAAAGHNAGTYSGNDYYCHYGTSRGVCLFYNANSGGAYFLFNLPSNTSMSGINYACYIPDFKGLTFDSFDPPGVSYGMGAPVKNNAASISNTAGTPASIFYNENYSGNYDWLPAHTYGNSSSYTLNNNASGDGNC